MVRQAMELEFDCLKQGERATSVLLDSERYLEKTNLEVTVCGMSNCCRGLFLHRNGDHYTVTKPRHDALTGTYKHTHVCACTCTQGIRYHLRRAYA